MPKNNIIRSTPKSLDSDALKFFLPIMEYGKKELYSKKEKLELLKGISDHPDILLVKEKLERDRAEEMWVRWSKDQVGDKKSSSLEISYHVRSAIRMLETCNFIRLITMMYQENPTLVIYLETPGIPQSPNMNDAFIEWGEERIKNGISARDTHIYLTEKGLDLSVIKLCGYSKYEDVLSAWGNTGKILLDKQGFGYRFSMFKRDTAANIAAKEFSLSSSQDTKLERDVRTRMIYSLSSCVVSEGVGVSIEQIKNQLNCMTLSNGQRINICSHMRIET